MFKKTLGFFIIGVLFLQAVPAQAYWGRGWRHDYYGHRFGPGYLALTVAGLDYLYYQGLFYRYTPGGYIIVDDYFSWASCRRAVTEFLAARSLEPAIVAIDRDGVYWRKE